MAKKKTCRWVMADLSYCGDNVAVLSKDFCGYHIDREEAQMIAEEKYGEAVVYSMSKKEYTTLIDDIMSDMNAEDG